MNTREELSKSIMFLKKERDRYLQLIKPDSGKLIYINCKKCGSAIRTDLFTGYTGKVCPACHNDMATEHEKDTIHLFDTLISELTFQKVASPIPKTEAKINIEANSHDLENKQDKTPVMHVYDLGGWTCF
jgi:hypothetical protein